MAQPNGTNGHTNSDHHRKPPEEAIPATHLLATFTATATPAHLTPSLRPKLKEVLLDYIGCTVGALTHADSTTPIYNAISALQGPTVTASTPGVCTVLGKGAPHFLPQYAGLLNAAFGHSLDFDDTYAPGTLHAGVTAISAALAQAETLASSQGEHSASSEEFMLAIAVGYEVTCRLGRELGYEAYSRGFHNTSTAGIFGAVAAISVLKHLPTETVEMAFGLAGSKAAGSMQYLDNGSWNKRLHPGFAVHDAFMCVALAEAGVIGATRILEGKSGFFNAYTPNEHVDLHRLIDQLGDQWVWLASSLKPYPACRMTHGFIELCDNIHDTHTKPTGSALSVDDIQAIELSMSPSNYLLIGDPTPNKRHPTNVIDAQFSAYFQVAHALLYGAKTGDMAPYSRLQDPALHQMTELITVRTDGSMKQFAAKLRLTWRKDGGRTEEAEQEYPLGEAEHPFTRERVAEKFAGLAGPVYGEQKAAEILRVVDGLEERSIEELVMLLR
ncbi:hypothetical protein LTR36_001549 [Oleoguttula mirabilis]|uniref:2-methylcitrate dehydratase n=1 Tax=Oleoguttula mirabilis TaxID=1507867 RepID=A0AAV9JN71_9PEZI|nr:hypothetical protein LTR36_001549 [Oleoguttula mirabilis]